MKRIRFAVMAALLFSLSFVVTPARALPSNEVDNYYYDANWDLVGEKDIYCDGTHFTWGITTGTAHRTTLTTPCDTGGGTWGCYYWDDECGCYVQVDLSYCGV